MQGVLSERLSKVTPNPRQFYLNCLLMLKKNLSLKPLYVQLSRRLAASALLIEI